MYSPNDNLQIALIGCGGMGQGDAHLATSIPGVKLIAACDCYDGRLEHMKEVYGADTFTTRDYREIVGRKDIDAVIIATPDHWHSRISVACLGAGKNVYCEKPMVHAIDEGKSVIEAQQKSGKVFQVGSQYRSSLMYQKAHELYKSGAIGQLNTVEAWLDRNTAMGAWQYTIPPDAGTKTCDWPQFEGNAPKHAWDPKRFFRWRNYRDYGTGVAGDLFVHLITGLHTVTDSIGPERIFATGGLRYWKDGRDVPDVMLATMDYPKTDINPGFNFVLRVNFKSGVNESAGVRFIGSDGSMTVSFADLLVDRVPRPDEYDYTIASFADAMQQRLNKAWEEKHPPLSVSTLTPDGSQKFSAEKHDPQFDHHKAFYRSIREGAPLIEDATFGLRAAGPALLTNQSLFTGKICGWNPQDMTTV